MFSLDKFASIRSSGKLFLGSSRKTRIISAVGLLLAACAFGAVAVAPMAPDPADLPVKDITEELALPQLAEQIAALSKQDDHYVSEERIHAGDTLASLLTRLGVYDDAAASFIKSDSTARAVLQLKAGKLVQAQVGPNGELLQLRTTFSDYHSNQDKDIVIERAGKGFKATAMPIALEKRIEMHSGEIKSSLFAATDAAQIPDNIASQLVDMFSTEIDFASDLHRGDRFNVVYETYWQNGEFVRSGRVLAAEFTNAGKTYQSVWFDEPSSKQGGGYYGFDGKSLKKAFLKSPLQFTRISSGFSMRLHPILGIWKKHEGVDFAAPIGTPIRAAADGVIDFEGQQRGYGNVIVIKHWGKYSTAYAHMSRFAGFHKGSKVNQGDVIGYVGMTGWATGPHLHYEFRINNVPHDPLSVDVPNTQALATADLTRFRAVAANMSHRFALLTPGPHGSDIKLASK
jgi:murein DD-endopeptidase MepM/ murein hydrolase activator NlpD